MLDPDMLIFHRTSRYSLFNHLSIYVAGACGIREIKCLSELDLSNC